MTARPSSRVALRVACCLVAWQSPSLLAAPVEVKLKLATEALIEGTVEAVPVTGTVDDRRRLEASTSGPVRFDLEPDVAWQIKLIAEGFWVAKKIYTPPREGGTVLLDVWRTGTLAGKVSTIGNEEPPRELTARFQPSRDAVNLDQTLVRCPVVESRFRCDLPAAELDLRLRARGFVSHFRWGVPMTAGKTTDLGTLLLERGASLVGWVAEEDGEPSPESCRVELTPTEAAIQRSDRAEERLQQLTLSERVDSRGFFHFRSIRPGSYTVVARQPGFAPASLFPVEVMEDAETELRDPLVLTPPITLRVHVDPALDLFGQPWKIVVWQKSDVPGSADEVASASASREGLFEHSGLSSGGYLLMVYDSRDARLAYREIDLSPTARDFEIEMPLIWVEGSVRLGEEPLSADLYFGGIFGVVRVLLTSDEEGDFSGYLPRDGEWRVHVEATAPPIKKDLPAVEVRKRKGTATAEVEISLPDTRLTGEVLDEEGKPVEALVKVLELETGLKSAARLDPEGQFAFHGLEGPVAVHAESSLGNSEEVDLTLAEDREPPHVQLVIRKWQEIVGRVVSASGGVPAADVRATAYREGRPLIGTRTASTEVDGSFRLSLPAAAQQVQITVFPPGNTLTVLPIRNIGEEPLTIAVNPHGGSVIFELEREIDWGDRWGAQPVLFVEGVAVPGWVLRQWAMINGEANAIPQRFSVPAMPPARYAACLITPSPASLPAQLSPTGRCVEGYLAPFGEMLVKLQ